MADTMTTEAHIEQLTKRFGEASRKEHAVDEVTGNLMIYLESPDGRFGYIVEITHLDEEAVRSYRADEIHRAEVLAGWDPNP